LKAIGEEIAKVERQQRLMARGIDTFGRQGRNIDELRTKYAQLTQESNKLRASQARLAALNAKIDAHQARQAEVGAALRGSVGIFGAAFAGVAAPAKMAADFETSMLGIAKQLSRARDKAGNLTPMFFGMARQVQHLGRDIPIATNELAEMVAAGLRMGVAKDEIIGFTRTAAMMADAFELPAGQIADDMGKVAGLFRIPIPRIGELADAINFLDDNSQAKGGQIVDVMRRIGGMAATLKMPAKEAAALGSTFVHLGSSAEVAGTASNAVMRILGAATAQSKRVRKGLESIGFDPADVQASMAMDATGTILRLLDKLNSLSSEQRMVAATRIFGAEYGDDLAKLATGADEYRRQLALVNGEQSKGSMSREFNARLKTTAAQWQLTKNRMTEVAVSIGGALLPSVNNLFGVIAPMVEATADWAQQNQGVVRVVLGATLALTGLRVATLAASFGYGMLKGAVLRTVALFYTQAAASAVAASATATAGTTAAGASSGFTLLGRALLFAGRGVLWIGRALMLNPIGLAVTAIAGGAYLIYKNWTPLKKWFAGLWSDITATAVRAIEWIVGKVAWIGEKWQQTKAFFGIGEAAGVSAPGASTGASRPAFAMPAPVRGRPAPRIPAATARAGATVVDSSTHTYHVTQQPGESGEALAQRIEAERRRRAGVDRRGSLIDVPAFAG
jgi:TP901 family phage tail tape measure protein